MREIILQFTVANLSALYQVRTIPGLQVAEDGDTIWMRTNMSQQQTPGLLWGLPAEEIFTLSSENYLFLMNKQTPVAKLRELTWISLPEFLPVETPVSALPGHNHHQLTVKIIPSQHQHPGFALLTTLRIWEKYGETAAEARLKKLRFAVSSKEEVFIMGKPLPAIPGTEYWKNGQILLPAGYDFAHPVIARDVENKLLENHNDWLIFYPDQRWSVIKKNQFVIAHRAAIRLTSANFEHGNT